MSEKMFDIYSAVFSAKRGGWCVFKALTSSIRLFHVKCSCEQEAEHVAEKLNLKEDENEK